MSSWLFFQGKVIIFPLYGKGPGQLQVVDFDLKVKTKLTIGSSIQMNDLDIQMSTGPINVSNERMWQPGQPYLDKGL